MARDVMILFGIGCLLVYFGKLFYSIVLWRCMKWERVKISKADAEFLENISAAIVTRQCQRSVVLGHRSACAEYCVKSDLSEIKWPRHEETTTKPKG